MNEYHFYKKAGRRLHPDEVWLLFLSNDVKKNPRRLKFVSPEGIATDNPGSRIPLRFRWVLRRSALYVFCVDRLLTLKQIYSKRKNSGKSPEKENSNLDASFNTLRELRGEVEKDGAVLKIAYFPREEECKNSIPRAENIREKLKEFCRIEGIPFMDLAGPFKESMKEGRNLYLPQDKVHPNRVGHSLIAKELRGFV